MKIPFMIFIALLIAISITNISCNKQTDYSPQINALQARCDSLAAALAATNAKLQATNNTVNSLSTSITAVQAQLTVIAGQISTLNTQLTATNSNVSSIQAQLTVIVGQIATLNTQLAATNSDVSSIKSQLEGIVVQINTLNTQLAATNATVTSINEQLIASNAQLTNLLFQFNALLASLGIVIDIDGNTYHTVTIGTQVWMAENLKVTKFRNGNPIPYWTQSSSRGYCWYNDNVGNKDIYGAIYNFYTATDSRSICPLGWHIPTVEEWTTLINYLGGESVAGGKIKESGTAHWVSPNTGATNSSGFRGLPGGSRDCANSYIGLGTSGHWWSSLIVPVGKVSGIYASATSNSLIINSAFDCNASYVRCIKD